MKYGTLENAASRLQPDEPWFFLRANDLLAPIIVDTYAEKLEATGDIHGAYEVKAIAAKMREWQKHNGCRLPD